MPRADDGGFEPTWQTFRRAMTTLIAQGALLPGCDALEVRYSVVPRDGASAEVRMFVTAMDRQVTSAVAEIAVDAAVRQLPDGFEVRPAAVGDWDRGADDDGATIVELRRREHVTTPEWEFIPAEFYYSVDHGLGDGSGWAAFWRTLTGVDEPVDVSLLVQQTELDPLERETVGSIMTRLGELAVPHSEYDLYGNADYFPACANAGEALERWRGLSSAMHRPVLARFAVRARPRTAAAVGAALAHAATALEGGKPASSLVPRAVASVAELRQARFSFSSLELAPWGDDEIWDHPRAPMTLRRFPYLYDAADVAGAFVLPVPDRHGVAGMRLARVVSGLRQHEVEASQQGLRLGRAIDGVSLGRTERLDLRAVNRHTLIVGAPGSGKSTTVLSLLKQLWVEHGVPFMVLESSKTEYRSLLRSPSMEGLTVITVGNDGLSPIRLNVMEPPPGVRCEAHRSSVLSALKMALPLFAPQPQILEKAIAQVYVELGWDDDTTIEDGVVPPTLRDLLRVYSTVFDEYGYQGEARNIGRGFQARLESLLQGSKGRMFDTTRSSDFADLLARPLVVELEELADRDEKLLVSAFLLERVRAAARRRGTSGGILRHVTVIEEAHRLLTKTVPSSSGDGSDGRADAVRSFCEAIAELRASGEGFVLSSQRPSELADAAVANTSTRIVHALNEDDDLQRLLPPSLADDQLRAAAARLRTGETVVRMWGRDELDLIQVVPEDDVSTDTVVADGDLAVAMSRHREETTRIRPYRLCDPGLCVSGCTASTRSRGSRVALRLAPRVRKRWDEGLREGVVPVAAVVDPIVRESGGDVVTSYCAAVHISVSGAALRSDEPEANRAPLRAAIERRIAADAGTDG